MKSRAAGGVRGRRGAILIVAMIIVFALASMAIVLGTSMRVEASVAVNSRSMREATAIARGAEQYVLGLVSEYGTAVDQLDESWFEGVSVGEGAFWIIRPDWRDGQIPRYGLLDEASKLDINTVSPEVLARLPGMTVDLAAAIVAWRDEEGLGETSYLALAEPYRAKAGAFETVEELMMVRGMTRELLYGPEVAARLGGAGEGAAMGRAFAGEYFQTDGLYDFFTVWSRQTTRRPEGGRRINVNSAQQRNNLRRLLRSRLGQERAQEVDGRLGGLGARNILDWAMRLELEAWELELLEPDIRVGGWSRSRGMANINTAPREVLESLEGMEAGDVDALLGQRAVSLGRSSMAWVLNVFPDYAAREEVREKVAELGDQITGRGGQFSADIVALSGDGRSFVRVRIVVDARPETPRVLYRREQTELGWPLEAWILESRRSGERWAMR